MYTPEHFREKDINEIKKIVDVYPLATLFTSGSKGFAANHIPFLIDFNPDGSQTILGHIARENELFRENKNGDEVLVVYKAQDTYITPNWYPTKKTTHKVVPTWNYQAVHFHGRISFFEDSKSLLGVVGRLTKLHEKKSDEKLPWNIKDAPDEFMASKLLAIVGIKIDVIRFEAKSKLSQNKEEIDFKSVKNKMLQKNKKIMFAAMEKIKLK